MKRFIVIIPTILLILLNACGNNSPQVSNDMGTAVANTQTAAVWTPTITFTPDPDESKIVDWLNQNLSNADSLEQNLDAKYQVGDVVFQAPYGVLTIMRVDAHCECATSTQCCSPGRMFIMVIRALKDKKDKVFEQVPPSVNELDVVCYNGRTAAFATMVASWPDVEDYLNEKINGVQFAYRVSQK
jgi:hypothetical protein